MQASYLYFGKQSDLWEVTKIDFKVPCGCVTLSMQGSMFQAKIKADLLGSDDLSIHPINIWAGQHLLIELNLVIKLKDNLYTSSLDLI